MPSERPGDLEAPPRVGDRAGTRLFVGRDSQLDRMLTALDDAFAGRGRVILLSGEPGIGKTRLAEEFAVHAAARGAGVVWGRSWEAGGAPAYWPWTESLRALFDVAGRDVSGELTLEADAYIAQLVPELRTGATPPAEVGPSSPETARFDLFVAVKGLLARASQHRPLVVILEDLHAADAPSLLLLRFVARTASEHRTVFVGTYRDVELSRDHPLSEALPELLRAPGAGRVTLPGLVEGDVAQLTRAVPQLDASPGLVSTIHRKTDGNPLFVQEYLRLLESEGRPGDESPQRQWPVPEGVREVIGRRLDRLPPGCTELLQLAAVAGREFRVDVLERASGQPGDVLLDTLHDAIEARLIEEVAGEPGRLRFAHALIRDALYEELAPGDRCRRHAGIGRALETTYVSDPGPFVAELAHHFFEAGPVGDHKKTVDYAVLAGTEAVRTLAYEEAVRLFQLAVRTLQDSPDDRRRGEVLVLLGDAQARAGDQTGSKETFLQAAAAAARIDDAEMLARSAIGYGGRFSWARAGNDGHLIPLLRQALDALPGTDDSLRARVLARLAGALRDQPSPEPRTSLAAEAVAMARRLGEPETLTYALLAWWGAAVMSADDIEQQLLVADELDELAQQGNDRELRADCFWVRYIAALTRGDMLTARRQHSLQRDLAAELQQAPQHWYTGTIATVIALQDGQFDEAEALIEQTSALGRDAQSWDADATRRFAMFVLRREQGRLAELEDDIRKGLITHPGYRSLRCMLLTLLIHGERQDEARALFDQLATDDFALFPQDNERLFALSLLAEAAASLHDRERAEILYDQLLPYESLVALAAWEVSLGPVHRPLGLLAAALDRRTDAAHHFEAAIESCTQMGARPWRAHAEADFAEMLITGERPEDRSRAVELATAARDTATQIGMTVLRDRAESLLAKLGTAPTTPVSEQAARLTRREREVAGLVARGLSNRQIAEQLFVSERTAETHVQNILTKLGFNARSQVAAWAVREGIGTGT